MGRGGWVADCVKEGWSLSRKVVVLVWGVQGLAGHGGVWGVQGWAGHGGVWGVQGWTGPGGVAHGVGQEGQAVVGHSLGLGGGLVWHFERSRSWGGFRRSWKIFI